MADGSFIVRLDHVVEEKFECCRNMRFIPFGLYEPLPDHRINFCIALLPYDAVNGLKQRHMTTEHCGVNEGYIRREGGERTS